jgi:phospholipase C
MSCTTRGAPDHGDAKYTSVDCDDTVNPCAPPDYGWTDLTYLLHKNGISWAEYTGTKGPEYWRPLADFQTVHADNQLSNIQDVSNFTTAAAAGTLPAVSWIIPGQAVSDHPAASLANGQAYVTSLINSVMQGPDWTSTAIFLAWDDWGGFYDHVVPPVLDGSGAGFRVPSIIISPFAKAGVVDHQTLTFDNYLKFIEDDFLGSQRIDPATDGRPDPRPDVRENSPLLGDLKTDFDFSHAPRPPMVLKVDQAAIADAAIHPSPTLTFTAGSDDGP